jgi:hypothetical protein
MFHLSVASVLALVGVVAASSSCPTTQLYGTYTVTPSSLTTGQVSRRAARGQVSFANPPFAEIYRREQLYMLERAAVPGEAQVHRLLHCGHRQSAGRLDIPDSAHCPAGDRRVQSDGKLTQRPFGFTCSDSRAYIAAPRRLLGHGASELHASGACDLSGPRTRWADRYTPLRRCAAADCRKLVGADR